MIHQSLRSARLLLLVGAAFVVFDGRSSSQPALETKQGFVSGLIRFMEALPGTYGDEGVGLSSALEAMEAGLRRWDAGLRAYSDAMTAQIKDARGAVGAALRLPLGATYLERGRIDEALREFAAAGELDPDRTEPPMFRGLALESAGRRSESVAAFRTAWRLDRQNPVAAYLTARYDAADGDLRETQEALQTLLALQRQRLDDGDVRRMSPFVRAALVEERGWSGDPVFAPAHYADGFKLIEQYKLEEALARFREAVATDPLVVDAAVVSGIVGQGSAAMRGGDLNAVLHVMEPAVQRFPDSSEAHRGLAMAYWMDDQYDRSIAEFRKAIELNPRDERAHLALADVLIEAERFAEAERVLREAVNVLPTSGQAHWKAGRVLQRLHKDVEAVQAFERAAAFTPLAGASRLYVTLGRLYLSASDLERSRAAFERSIEIDPNSSEAHRQLGDVDRKLGRHDAALLEFLVAVIIEPQDAASYVGAGQTFLETRRYADAVGAFKRAVALKPEDKEARYGLATALMRSGEVESGTRELEVYRRLQAESLAADRRAYEINQLKIEAALASQEGDIAKAVTLWQQVVQSEPDAATNHVKLGLVLGQAGRHDAALESFRNSLTHDADPVVHRYIADEQAALGRREESAQERATYVRLKQERLRQAAR